MQVLKIAGTDFEVPNYFDRVYLQSKINNLTLTLSDDNENYLLQVRNALSLTLVVSSKETHERMKAYLEYAKKVSLTIDGKTEFSAIKHIDYILLCEQLYKDLHKAFPEILAMALRELI